MRVAAKVVAAKVAALQPYGCRFRVFDAVGKILGIVTRSQPT